MVRSFKFDLHRNFTTFFTAINHLIIEIFHRQIINYKNIRVNYSTQSITSPLSEAKIKSIKLVFENVKLGTKFIKFTKLLFTRDNFQA